MNGPQEAQGRSRSDIVQDLVDRYHDRLFAFARRHADAAVAEDVVQEAFLRVLSHPRLLEMEISISYLLRIVHNLLKRRHSRAVRLRQILETDVVPRLRGRARGTSGRSGEEAVLAIGGEALEAAMARLGEDERAAIRFVVCDGRSYAEAARSLGVSVTTINNWKHRGLRKLRQALIRGERARSATRGRAG